MKSDPTINNDAVADAKQFPSGTPLDTLSKALRDCIGTHGTKLWGSSTPEDIIMLLKVWANQGIEVSKVVNHPNCNGKSALMFATQYRGDVPMCQALVQAKADINANTNRGHTPLIYAAGRGRDDVVLFLLQLGAATRVRTVNGDTAMDMGKERLQQSTVRALEAAHEVDDRQWVDFRFNESAVAAQAEHVRRCPWCRAKQAAESLTQEATHSNEELLAHRNEALGPLREAVEQIHLGVTISPNELSTALLQAAIDLGKDAQETMTPVIKDLATTRESIIAMLQAMRDEVLGRALLALGMKDRRPLRSAIVAILRAFAAQPAGFGDITARMVISNSDPETALEIFALKALKLSSPADQDTVIQFWKEMLQPTRETDGYTGEVIHAMGKQVHRRDGGMLIARFARIANCASEVRLHGWREVVLECMGAAASMGKLNSLIKVIADQKILEPNELETMVSELPNPSLKPVVDTQHPSVVPHLIGETMKILQLSDLGNVAMVDSTYEVRGIEELLRVDSMSGSLHVGLDTEWDDANSISTLQLAFLKNGAHQAWVIDMLPVRHGTDIEYIDEVKAVIRCLIEEPLISIVGFDLRHDLERLYKMFPDLCPPPRGNVLDVQKMSMNLLKPKKGKGFKQPSLKETCEYWLGQSLDKAEQCSNWALRPLSDSQITYAGLDAVVVLEVLRKLQPQHLDCITATVEAPFFAA